MPIPTNTPELFIPPNSKHVIELVDADSDFDFELGTKENFLLINPQSDYKVANDFNIDGKADTILFQSSSFATMPVSRLTRTIKDVAEHLNDGGMIVFILDNIGRADNVEAILDGNAPTVRATLNFENLINAIQDAGLITVKTLARSRETKVRRVVAEIAKTQLQLQNFIVAAVKPETAMVGTTLIHSYIGEKMVCATVRIHEPNRMIATGVGITLRNEEVQNGSHLVEAGSYNNMIFINQRVSSFSPEAGIKTFNDIVSRGYLLIEEMDDHPIWWKEKYIQNKFINFIACHGVQASTDSLGDLFRQFNPNVRVFGNHLSTLPLPRDFDEEAKQDKPVSILFAALNRDKDFDEIAPALNEVLAECGDKVVVNVISRRAIFNQINCPNKNFLGDDNYYDGQIVPFDVYEQILRNTDISLLPLRDVIFNRSKSDLKFIECAGNGAVILASPVVYAKSVVDGETGFIYHDMKEFVSKLRLLINDGNKRRDIAKKAYDYVKYNRLLSQHYMERLDWYRELLARRDELTAEVRKRCENIDKYADAIAHAWDE